MTGKRNTTSTPDVDEVLRYNGTPPRPCRPPPQPMPMPPPPIVRDDGGMSKTQLFVWLIVVPVLIFSAGLAALLIH